MYTSGLKWRSLAVLVLVGLLVSACGGAPQVPATSAPAATATGSSSSAGGTPAGDATAAPKPTPNNAVVTVAPSGDNFDFATAQALDAGAVKTTVNEQKLYYKIDVPRGGVLTATLGVDAGSPEPARLTLYDELQKYMSELDVPVGKTGRQIQIFAHDAGGTIFMSVEGNSSFTLQGVAARQNDGGSGDDAGDEEAAPTTIQTGQSSGLLGGGDRSDFYTVDLPKTGQVLSVTFETTDETEGEARLTIFDDQHGWRTEMDSLSSDPGAVGQELVLPAGEGGRWYVQVSGRGTYEFNVQSTPQDDAGSQEDAGGDFDQASLIDPGEFSGLMGGTDTEDHYSFDVANTGAVLSFTFKTLEAADGQFRFTLLDDQLNWKREFDISSSETPEGAFQYVLQQGQGGHWHIQMAGTGRYEFSVQVAPQDDAGTGTDAPDEASRALRIDEAPEFTGLIGGDDNADVYEIDDSLGRTVTLTYTAGEGTLSVGIVTAAGHWVQTGELTTAGDTLELQYSGSDKYFVWIQGDDVAYSVAIEP